MGELRPPEREWGAFESHCDYLLLLEDIDGSCSAKLNLCLEVVTRTSKPNSDDHTLHFDDDGLFNSAHENTQEDDNNTTTVDTTLQYTSTFHNAIEINPSKYGEPHHEITKLKMSTRNLTLPNHRECPGECASSIGCASYLIVYNSNDDIINCDYIGTGIIDTAIWYDMSADLDYGRLHRNSNNVSRVDNVIYTSIDRAADIVHDPLPFDDTPNISNILIENYLIMCAGMEMGSTYHNGTMSVILPITAHISNYVITIQRNHPIITDDKVTFSPDSIDGIIDDWFNNMDNDITNNVYVKETSMIDNPTDGQSLHALNVKTYLLGNDVELDYMKTNGIRRDIRNTMRHLPDNNNACLTVDLSSNNDNVALDMVQSDVFSDTTNFNDNEDTKHNCAVRYGASSDDMMKSSTHNNDVHDNKLTNVRSTPIVNATTTNTVSISIDMLKKRQ